MRSNATAKGFWKYIARASRGWANDDRSEETDFDFGETDKGASPGPDSSPLAALVVD